MKSAAGTESALDPDAPAVRFHDAPGHVQAETEAPAVVLTHLAETLDIACSSS
jgi:hypothetical protein